MIALLNFLLFPVVLFLGLAQLASVYISWNKEGNRNKLLATLSGSKKRALVGFFHPFCNAGGGGERVLWVAIAYLQRTEPTVVSVVYTGDTDASKDQIIERVKARFGITLDPSTLVFMYLRSRYLVEDATWKRFTLLGQSLGSMYMAWEAMSLCIPDIFIDTMGYAFTFPLLRLLRLRTSAPSLLPSSSHFTSNSPATQHGHLTRALPICAYVHYPTISTDMLTRVKTRQHGVTNSSSIASSPWKSTLKLWYYKLFAAAYSASLAQADEVMVNGSWTKAHVDRLLFGERRNSKKDDSNLDVPAGIRVGVRIVYPPCDTESLQKLKLEGRERILLSVAQFRPEKDHPAQLRALARLFKLYPSYRSEQPPVRLVLLGSVRNDSDQGRVDDLKKLATELGIEAHVQFVLNAPYEDLVKWLGRASVGVSSMVDEHFGIGVVEMQAAGLIAVVHSSGGPLLDIVTPVSLSLTEPEKPTGFLYSSQSSSSDDFAEKLHAALSLSLEEQLAMRERARFGARRFGTREFEEGWGKGWTRVKGMLSGV